MFAFLIILAVEALLFVASQLLQPGAKSTAGAPQNTNVKPPTVSRGTPIPIVFGTQRLGVNLVWYGNVRAVAIKVKVAKSIFSSEKITTGYKYGFDFVGVLCHGPIDALLDLCWENKSSVQHQTINDGSLAFINFNFPKLHDSNPPSVAYSAIPNRRPSDPDAALVTGGGGIWLSTGDDPAHILAHDPNLFGGSTSDGGIETCLIDFYWGTAGQTASRRAALMLGAAQSAYQGLCYLVSQGGIFGNNPYPKTLTAVVKRCPKTLSTAAGHPEWGDIDGDANGAEAIYDLLTSASMPAGFGGCLTMDPANFDHASFTAAAQTLATEGLGVSFTLDTLDAAETALTNLLTIVDGVLFTHPETGLVTLKLLRADYDLSACVLIDETNSHDLQYQETGWPETFNVVQVQYVDRGLESATIVSGDEVKTDFNVADAWPFQNDVVTVDNLANQQAQGNIAVAQALSYPYLSNADTALQVAQRALRIVSRPWGKGSFKTNRIAHAFTVGQVVLVSSARFEISRLPMRVGQIQYGKLEAGDITVTVTQDVYTSRPPMYVPPTTLFRPPLTAAALPTTFAATEVPYFLNDVTTPTAMRILTAAVRPAQVELDYDVYSRVTGSGLTPPLTRQSQPFTSGGTLRGAYAWATPANDPTGFVIENTQDMDAIASTDSAGVLRGDVLALLIRQHDGEPLVLEEIVSIETIALQSDGSFLCTNVVRGQLDTHPRTHPSGTYVLFLSNGDHGLTQDAPYAVAQSIDIWLGPNGISARLDYGGGTTFPAPMATAAVSGRAINPYAPAGLAINGSTWPVFPTSVVGDLTLTWNSRNRLTQTAMLLQTDAPVTPEGDFEIKVTLAGTLARTDIATTSPYVYTAVMHAADVAATGGALITDPVKFEVRGKNGTLFSAVTYAPGGVPGDADSLTVTMS